MSEYKLHTAIKAHIEQCFIGVQNPDLKFWHCRNESRDAADAFWGKQMGVLPGVLDFQFGWPVSKAGVLEVKWDKGKLSSAQNKFISWANHIGWETGVAYTVKQAHAILKSWGLKPAFDSVHEPDYASWDEKVQRAIDVYAPS